MKFLVEAHIHGIERYRLQKDDSWTPAKYDPKLPVGACDVVFNELDDAGLLIAGLPEEIVIDGKKYPVNPSSLSLGKPVAWVQPIVYRLTRPRKFSEAEVRSVIASGNDDVNNALTVNLEGRVRLREFDSGITSDFAGIAVRNEAFCAGNDYVGFAASEDKSHVKSQYLTLLDGWVAHLATGRLNIFQDLVPDETEEALLKEVGSLTAHLK